MMENRRPNKDDVLDLIYRLDAVWREERDEKQVRVDDDFEFSEMAKLCLDASDILSRMIASD